MLAENSHFPFSEKQASSLSAGSLNCIRNNFSEDTYKKFILERTTKYVAKYPKQSKYEADLLLTGVSRNIDKLISIGILSKNSSETQLKMRNLFAGMSDFELGSFMWVMTKKEYANLRELIYAPRSPENTGLEQGISRGKKETDDFLEYASKQCNFK